MPRKLLWKRTTLEIELDMKACVEGISILGSALQNLHKDNPMRLKEIVAASKELVSYSERLLSYSAELLMRKKLKD